LSVASVTSGQCSSIASSRPSTWDQKFSCFPNLGYGILVTGNGNGTADPVELNENTVEQNGLDGIRIDGVGHELHRNTCDGNVGCEFAVVAGSFDAKDNRANGAIVPPNSNGQPFPTGCVENP
jgi:hypothetical protein